MSKEPEATAKEAEQSKEGTSEPQPQAPPPDMASINTAVAASEPVDAPPQSERSTPAQPEVQPVDASAPRPRIPSVSEVDAIRRPGPAMINPDAPASRRARARMTLRIPDDNVPVSRAPSSPDLEAHAAVAQRMPSSPDLEAMAGPAAMIRAMRIIAVGEAPPARAPDLSPVPSRVAGEGSSPAITPGQTSDPTPLASPVEMRAIEAQAAQQPAEDASAESLTPDDIVVEQAPEPGQAPPPVLESPPMALSDQAEANKNWSPPVSGVVPVPPSKSGQIPLPVLPPPPAEDEVELGDDEIAPDSSEERTIETSAAELLAGHAELLPPYVPGSSQPPVVAPVAAPAQEVPAAPIAQAAEPDEIRERLPSFEVPLDIDVDVSEAAAESGSEITPRKGVRLPHIDELAEPEPVTAPRPPSTSSPVIDVPPPPASLIESVRPPPVAPAPLDLPPPPPAAAAPMDLPPPPPAAAAPMDLPPPPVGLPPPPADLPLPPVVNGEAVAPLPPPVSPQPPAVAADASASITDSTALSPVPPLGVGPPLPVPTSPLPPPVKSPVSTPRAAIEQVQEAASAADAVEVADVELVEEQPTEPKRAAPPPAPPRSKPSGTRPKVEATPSPTGVAAAPVAPVQSTPSARPRVRVWWEEAFTDDFVRSMDKLTAEQVKREVRFIEESLAVSKGGVMLDLGCGTGQHAVELAARGYSVVGYDLSLTMLALAADEAQARGQKLNFLQGDMREMAFEEMFDGVFSWSTSFGYFDHEKNCEVIRRVQRALRTGGMFLLDIVNRDYLISRTPTMGWFEGDGCVCMDEAKFDAITSRLLVKRTLMLDDGRAREIEYSIRLYSLHEIGKMVNDAGFKVVEVSGHPATAGVFMGAESPRLITLAEKR